MKYLASLLIILSISSPAYAGEITRADEYSDFKWKSSECLKPIFGPARAGQSENDRVVEYAREVDKYIACIQAEAQRDFERAQQEMYDAVQNEVQREVDNMNGMVEQAAKSTW